MLIFSWAPPQSQMVDTRTSDAGVTLIEILVVLVLIGVSAGVVLYALPSGSNPRTVREEAGLLVSRLNIAAERSLMNGQSIKLEWTSTGYGFEEWTEGGWQKPSSPPLSQDHILADDLALTGEGGRQQGIIRLSPDLLPKSGGLDVLRLGGGNVDRTITFDGASAVLSATTP